MIYRFFVWILSKGDYKEAGKMCFPAITELLKINHESTIEKDLKYVQS